MSFLSSDSYIAALRMVRSWCSLPWTTCHNYLMCSLRYRSKILAIKHHYLHKQVLLICCPYLTGKVLSPFLLSISRWGTGYHRKFSFQLNPPYVISDPAMYSNVSSLITSMIGHTTVFLLEKEKKEKKTKNWLFFKQNIFSCYAEYLAYFEASPMLLCPAQQGPRLLRHCSGDTAVSRSHLQGPFCRKKGGNGNTLRKRKGGRWGE